MTRANCPFCGEENNVGTMPEKEPGEPYAMMKMCPHFVYYAYTPHPASEYVQNEFHIDFGKVPSAYSLEADLLRILNGHFKFSGPYAFAPDLKARAAARVAIADFLKAQQLIK